MLSQGLDPKDRAVEYIEAAEELLREAREELGKGNIRQAAQKLWSAAALAVKAYAAWRDGKRLSSYRELWEYKRKLEEELGEWVHDAWMNATSMHVCFYEDWCAERDISMAYRRVENWLGKSLLESKTTGLCLFKTSPQISEDHICSFAFMFDLFHHHKLYQPGMGCRPDTAEARGSNPRGPTALN